MKFILVPAHNPSGWTGPTGNNTYLLPGAAPTLIDAGVGHSDHVEEIARRLGTTPLSQVLITHAHPDHVGGLPQLLARWDSLSVFSPPASEANTQDSRRIPAGGGELLALYTPGHSPDHFCFFDEAAGDVYCGDLARANGTIVIPARKGGRLRDYLASLKRIRDLAPRRLLPGHGPIVNDPASLIDGYIAHRADRERQIIEALGRRAATAEEIVPKVYGTLAATLHAAAADSVLAHLVKLEEDGRAGRREDGRWVYAG